MASSRPDAFDGVLLATRHVDGHSDERKYLDDSDNSNRHAGQPHQLQHLTWDLDLSAYNFPTPIPSKVKSYSDPFSLPAAYKTTLTILGCIANFSTTYSGGSYTSGVSAMSAEFGVSRTAILVGVTIYTMGFAITPMALAPLSELYGRRPMFIISGLVYMIGVLLCGVTRLYVGMLLARLLVGISSSIFAVVVVGVVADIYADDAARTKALTWFTAGALFGNGCGPLVSGFIVQRVGWRWLFYALAIFLAGMMLAFVLFWKETRSEVLLSRKAAALNSWLDENESTGVSVRFTTKKDEARISPFEMIRLSLMRPFQFLFTEPVVLFFSLWAAFSWSIMYALLIIVPYTFQTLYAFDLETASSIFAAMSLGSILATILSLSHTHIANLCLPTSLLESKSPETRLYFAGVEGALLPIGLFWYGWSASAQTHWIVPALALTAATMGMFSIYLAVFSYLSAAYPLYAASANAAQSFTRNLLGGAFPLFCQVMFERLGFGGACSLLGGVGILLTCVPWALIFFGPQIRARSRFAFAEE